MLHCIPGPAGYGRGPHRMDGGELGPCDTEWWRPDTLADAPVPTHLPTRPSLPSDAAVSAPDSSPPPSLGTPTPATSASDGVDGSTSSLPASSERALDVMALLATLGHSDDPPAPALPFAPAIDDTVDVDTLWNIVARRCTATIAEVTSLFGTFNDATKLLLEAQLRQAEGEPPNHLGFRPRTTSCDTIDAPLLEIAAATNQQIAILWREAKEAELAEAQSKLKDGLDALPNTLSKVLSGVSSALMDAEALGRRLVYEAQLASQRKTEQRQHRRRTAKPAASTPPAAAITPAPPTASRGRKTPTRPPPEELDLLRGGKTSTMVVMSGSNNKEMCTQHLADSTIYQVVDSIPAIHERFKRCATADVRPRVHKQVWQRLSTPGPRVPDFYGLPKLHKNPVVIRPIVSSVDSPTYYWAVFIHLELWQSVVGHPSTLVNSADLLKELADAQLSSGLTFLTLDVKSLYTLIEHKHGVDALNEFLVALDYPIRSTLVALMELVLANNFFLLLHILMEKYQPRQQAVTRSAVACQQY